jgi:hypothetical protein
MSDCVHWMQILVKVNVEIISRRECDVGIFASAHRRLIIQKKNKKKGKRVNQT